MPCNCGGGHHKSQTCFIVPNCGKQTPDWNISILMTPPGQYSEVVVFIGLLLSAMVFGRGLTSSILLGERTSSQWLTIWNLWHCNYNVLLPGSFTTPSTTGPTNSYWWFAQRTANSQSCMIIMIDSVCQDETLRASWTRWTTSRDPDPNLPMPLVINQRLKEGSALLVVGYRGKM